MLHLLFKCCYYFKSKHCVPAAKKNKELNELKDNLVLITDCYTFRNVNSFVTQAIQKWVTFFHTSINLVKYCKFLKILPLQLHNYKSD